MEKTKSRWLNRPSLLLYVLILSLCFLALPSSAFSFMKKKAPVEKIASDSGKELNRLTNLPLSDENMQAYVALGQKYRYQKEYDVSILILRKGIERYPKSSDLYDTLGWVLIDAKRWPEATKALEEAVKHNQKNYGTYLGLWLCYRQEGDSVRGREVLEKAEALEPDSDWVQTEWGWYYYDEKDYAAAIKRFKRAIALNRERYMAYVGCAYAYDKTNDVVDAKEMLQKAIKKDPDNPLALIELGRLYRKHGLYDQGGAILQEAKKKHADDVRIYIELSNLYDRQGKDDTAAAVLLEALQCCGDDTRLYFLLIQTYRKNKKYKEVLKTLKKALVLYPGEDEFVTIRNELGGELINKGQYGVVEELLEGTEVPESDADMQLYCAVGKCYRHEKEYDKSISLLHKGLDKYPDSDRLYDTLGWVLIDVKRWPEATKALQEAVKRNQKNYGTYMGLWFCYRTEKDYNRGYAALVKAEALAPDSAWVCQEYGWYYYAVGAYEDACTMFSRAARCDDKSPDPYIGLGKSYQKLGDEPNAIQSFLHVLKIDKNNRTAYSELADGMAAGKAFPAFERKFAAYIKEHPHDAISYLWSGWYYRGQGKDRQAMALFNDAIVVYPDNYIAYMGLWLCARDMHDYDTGKKALEKAYALSPDSTWACQEYGWYYYKTGDYVKAIELFEKARAGDAATSSNPCVGLGKSYRALGEDVKATESFLQALAIDKNNRAAYMELKEKAAAPQSYPLMEERCRMWIEQHPHDAAAGYSALGWCYFYQKKYALADEQFSHLYGQSAHSVAIRENLGWYYYARGERKKGDKMFSFIFKQERPDIETFLALGNFYMGQKRYGRAETVLQSARTVYPHDYRIDMLLGIIYQRVQNYKKAEAALARAREENAPEGLVCRIRGEGYCAKGSRFSYGYRTLERLFPHALDYSWVVAIVHCVDTIIDGGSFFVYRVVLSKNPPVYGPDMRKAEQLLLQALEKDETKEKTYAALAELYVRWGRYDDARTILSMMPFSNDGVEEKFELVCLHFGDVDAIRRSIAKNIPPKPGVSYEV